MTWTYIILRSRYIRMTIAWTRMVVPKRCEIISRFSTSTKIYDSKYTYDIDGDKHQVANTGEVTSAIVLRAHIGKGTPRTTEYDSWIVPFGSFQPSGTPNLCFGGSHTPSSHQIRICGPYCPSQVSFPYHYLVVLIFLVSR